MTPTMLRREGNVNHKRCNGSGERRPAVAHLQEAQGVGERGLQQPHSAEHPHQVWAMDQFDATTDRCST